MVSLEEEKNGVVVLRLAPPHTERDEADYLDALERLAAIDRPYLLLAVFGGARALSAAGERGQALWFKRTRATIEAHCRACAIVRPDASEQTIAVFRRLWSFPLAAAVDEQEGRAFLDRHRGT